MDPLSKGAKPPSAPQLVADQIRLAVQMGHLLPGERLPPERELAVQVGVSRTTLREAIRALAAEGLVEVRHGRLGGPVILEPHFEPDELRRMLAERQKHVDVVFEFRRTVESETARLAAERRTEQDVDDLRGLLVDLDDVIERRTEGRTVMSLWRAADTAFHLRIAEIARNEMLFDSVQRGRAEMYYPASVALLNIEPYMNDPHVTLVDAIEARNPSAAAETMAEHITETWRAVSLYIANGGTYEPGR